MNRYKIIDAHCDTAGEVLDRGEHLEKNSCHLSLEHISDYQSYIQFFAAWVSKKEKDPFARAAAILSYVKQEIAMHADTMEEVHTSDEAEAILKRNKRGAMLALEDGRSICGSVEKLHAFYDMGVRAVTLAWNDDNEITDGILSNRGAGLTPFGKEVVGEMNRLHMMIDVSHISEKGFWDVLEASSAPVMASHSNCRAVCGHARNLSDAQIKALITNRGFIGINLYRDFLVDNGEATLEHIISHIDHIFSLGGEESIGLGSDFDGMDALPSEIKHAGDYVKLFDKMLALGYSESVIDKITHKNMLNFMKRIEK